LSTLREKACLFTTRQGVSREDSVSPTLPIGQVSTLNEWAFVVMTRRRKGWMERGFVTESFPEATDK